jgi:hypothetical protein
MIRSRVAVIAMLALAATHASCGRGEGPALYPVDGTVKYKGAPASGAYVVLLRDAPAAPGAPAAGEEPPSAMVEEDGSFTVSSGDKGNGALAGTYKVMITWRTGVGADAAKAQEESEKKKRGARARITRADKHAMLAPDRLKGRYSQPEKPLLTAEVKPETNHLPPFELTD